MQDRVNIGYADVYMLGTYRYHRSETLLIITLPDYLEYCPEIREYAQNFSVVLEQVNVERSKLFAKSRKTILSNCPYKKIQLCILPPYNSTES